LQWLSYMSPRGNTQPQLGQTMFGDDQMWRTRRGTDGNCDQLDGGDGGRGICMPMWKSGGQTQMAHAH
jgi:hypothetical protein